MSNCTHFQKLMTCIKNTDIRNFSEKATTTSIRPAITAEVEYGKSG